MMNIKKAIHKIPSARELEKRLMAYAKIDYLMNYDDEWLKTYHYDDKNWIEGGQYFRIEDGCGDHYHVLISPAGSVIKGFGHESDMSPYNWEEDDPAFPASIRNHDFYQGMPKDLFALIDDEALEKNLATFCVWQRPDEAQWTCAPIDIPHNWSDGSENFLEYVLDLQEYAKWFSTYYEKPIDMETLDKLYHGMEITKDMIENLSTEHTPEKLLGGLAQEF
jgi:hypothetical protein